MISPQLQRILVGLGLGGLIGSGQTAGLGTMFLSHFLKPLATKATAVEFLARYMHAEENAVAKLFRTRIVEWDQLGGDEREMWKMRARNALTGLAHLISEGLAGQISKRVK